MEVKQIVEELDKEISRLKEARVLLAGAGTTGRKRGRPPGKVKVVRRSRKGRISAEGRKRISEALKRRWAERRKAAAKVAKAA